MGYIVLLGYDLFGNAVSEVDAAGNWFVPAFDANGDQTSAGVQWVNPANPADVEDLEQKTYYDANGNATLVVQATNRTARLHVRRRRQCRPGNRRTR